LVAAGVVLGFMWWKMRPSWSDGEYSRENFAEEIPFVGNEDLVGSGGRGRRASESDDAGIGLQDLPL
jgi:hypothetical protein